jgi:hypothetical protein
MFTVWMQDERRKRRSEEPGAYDWRITRPAQLLEIPELRTPLAIGRRLG